MTLLATIFLLVLLIEAIGWVGKPLLLSLAIAIYARTFDAHASKKLRNLKKSILQDQTQLAQTSSQDEFAKWAKLRRKVDKGLSDLENLNAEQSAKRNAISLKFNTVLWVLTSGLQLFIMWWYRKEAVFYVPRGWYGPAEWLLALPSAPRGAVSCTTWQMACQRTIKVVERVVRDLSLQPWLERDMKTKTE